MCCSEMGPAYPHNLAYKKLSIQETFDYKIYPDSKNFKFIDSVLELAKPYCSGKFRSPAMAFSFSMENTNFYTNNK